MSWGPLLLNDLGFEGKPIPFVGGTRGVRLLWAGTVNTDLRSLVAHLATHRMVAVVVGSSGFTVHSAGTAFYVGVDALAHRPVSYWSYQRLFPSSRTRYVRAGP